MIENWAKKVLAAKGAEERVDEIEAELRSASCDHPTHDGWDSDDYPDDVDLAEREIDALRREIRRLEYLLADEKAAVRRLQTCLTSAKEVIAIDRDYGWPKPAEPDMCLLDHYHTVECAPIPRGEIEERTAGVPGLDLWWRKFGRRFP